MWIVVIDMDSNLTVKEFTDLEKANQEFKKAKNEHIGKDAAIYIADVREFIKYKNKI